MVRTRHINGQIYGEFPAARFQMWGEVVRSGRLRREIKEETNLEVSEIEFVMVQDCTFTRKNSIAMRTSFCSTTSASVWGVPM